MSRNREATSHYPSKIRLLSFNCWGLKYISKYRHERLKEIGAQIAKSDPPPDIACLQECWTQQDYQSIRAQTKHILPFGKFYYSGIFGGGLAVLSKWPIEESSMFRYPLNGRPTAFWRGDWYVGKGVACARIRLGPSEEDFVQIFNTHLHAPYAAPNSSGAYVEHRTSQAWEISKLLRHASERGDLVIGMGDFNISPRSLAYRIICAHGRVQDSWRVLHPDSAIAAAASRFERKRRGQNEIPTAMYNLTENGTTCDSALNTWRWDIQMRKQLHRGKDVDDEYLKDASDPRAKRLDYIFLGSAGTRKRHQRQWMVEEAKVGMTMRHPQLRCSLSDHFSVEATLSLHNVKSTSDQVVEPPRYLHASAYRKLLKSIMDYTDRSLSQRRYRLAHLALSITVSAACLVGVWWSPNNYTSFILLLLSTLGLSTGAIDGLIGGLFFSQETRALKELRWEVENEMEAAQVLRSQSADNEDSVILNAADSDDENQG